MTPDNREEQVRDRIHFAWLPVPLSHRIGRTWYYTGMRAWLERVRVIETFWGDTIYVALGANDGR